MPSPIKLTLAAMLLSLSLSNVARATEQEPIPTMLVGDGNSTEYPDPICSKCTIIVVEDEDSAGTQAIVRIGYPMDAPRFEGGITMTVLLFTGERHTLWMPNVTLAPGDDLEQWAEAGADWSWEEVRFVWLRFEEG